MEKKFYRFALIVSLLNLVLIAACGKDPRAFKVADNSRYDIPYASGLPGEELLKLDAHWPNNAKGLPIIVYIHGGGWTSSDKKVMDPWCKRMSARGYVVFNVNYRLAPKFQFPTAVNDSLGAMCWITQHAAEFGGDVSRIGLTGGSAGGHLIAMVATAWNDPHFQPTGYEGKKLDLHIKAQVPYFGVFDFDRPGALSVLGLPKKFLGSRKDAPDNYRLASPINYVTKNTPPTFMVVGALDPIYPQTRRYYDALSKVGVHVEMKVYPLQTHGFDYHFRFKSSQDSFERMMGFFSRYLKD